MLLENQVDLIFCRWCSSVFDQKSCYFGRFSGGFNQNKNAFKSMKIFVERLENVKKWKKERKK
jgi:hypothetical protein